MSNIELKLTDEQLSAAISGAILGMLSEQSRDDMVRQALEHIMVPAKNSYGKAEPSILEQAVRRGISALTFTVAEEYVRDNPEFREAIKQALVETTTQVLTDKRGMREALSSALLSAIGNEEYWR